MPEGESPTPVGEDRRAVLSTYTAQRDAYSQRVPALAALECVANLPHGTLGMSRVERPARSPASLAEDGENPQHPAGER